MKKLKLCILIILMRSFYGLGYWEWTPQTKKWINPKYAVKSTPEEQFNYAEEFRKNGKIDIAIREHKKLLNIIQSQNMLQSHVLFLEKFIEKWVI
jgi:hypothetical protein